MTQDLSVHTFLTSVTDSQKAEYISHFCSPGRVL